MNDAEFQALKSRMINGVIAQGEGSIENGRCKYRGPAGLKCAVGMIIPDELYALSMDSRIMALSDVLYDAGFELSMDQMDVIATIQHCHDAAAMSTQRDTCFIGRFTSNLQGQGILT